MKFKPLLICSLVCCIAASYSGNLTAAEIKETSEALFERGIQEQEQYLKPNSDMEVKSDAHTAQMKLVSVGDIMMHEEEIVSGYRPNTKTYDYHYMFKTIKPYIEDGDLAIGNLELTMAGKEKRYTGYPRFNAPDELADALKNTGFDILTTANNHSLDRRYEGVSHTLQILDKAGISHVGSARTAAEQEQVLIKEVNGIKMAFLAYTYGTNGIPFDKGKAYSVNLIDKNKIKKHIARAKALKADLICVSIHFGEENQRTPNKNQKETVDFLAAQGADIILGNHPHVLQPLEIRKVKLSAARTKECVILYSQGNFISTQRERYQDTSAVFNIKIEKNLDTNEIKIKNVAYVPVWTDLSRLGKQYHFRVLPIKKYMAVYQSKQDKLLSAADYNKLVRGLMDARAILKNNDKRIGEQF